MPEGPRRHVQKVWRIILNFHLHCLPPSYMEIISAHTNLNQIENFLHFVIFFVIQRLFKNTSNDIVSYKLAQPKLKMSLNQFG